MKDEYEVIRAGNITVAQGYKCQKCKLLRPYFMKECPCGHKPVQEQTNSWQQDLLLAGFIISTLAIIIITAIEVILNIHKFL